MTDTIDPARVAEIAKGLTKGQRRLVTEMNGSWVRQKVGVGGVSNLRAYPLVYNGLAKHFYEADKANANLRKRYARLTPLGLSVRQHLIGEQR